MGFLAAAAAMRAVHDVARNLERYHRFITEAAAAGVRLLVLPEGSLQGYLYGFNRGFAADESSYHWEHAETIPGPSTAQIIDWAVETGLYINFGMFERDGFYLYNTSVLVGPEGLVASYRKIHQPLEERVYYQTGARWCVARTELAQIGLMICYDQTFPEAARELTLRGAEVLAVPSAWAWIDEQSAMRYDLFSKVRALENNRWLIQSNQVGKIPQDDRYYLGRSRIINPDGVVVAQTDEDEEGLALAEVQPSVLDPKHGFTRWYLRQRRPRLYRSLNKR